MCIRDLPDMYVRGPRATAGPWAYILGKSLMPMLQLLHVAGIEYSYQLQVDLIVLV